MISDPQFSPDGGTISFTAVPTTKADDGSLSDMAYAPVFGDFQDLYIAFFRFLSVGAIFSSPVVDRGTLYFGSADGRLYAIR